MSRRYTRASPKTLVCIRSKILAITPFAYYMCPSWFFFGKSPIFSSSPWHVGWMSSEKGKNRSRMNLFPSHCELERFGCWITMSILVSEHSLKDMEWLGKSSLHHHVVRNHHDHHDQSARRSSLESTLNRQKVWTVSKLQDVVSQRLVSYPDFSLPLKIIKITQCFVVKELPA